MLSINLIEKRISDLEHAIIPQDIYSTTIHKGRIDILYWVKQTEEVRTEEEINKKISRIQEEQIPYKPEDIWYKEKEAKIKELKYILSEDEVFT